jgi:tetratricopeptide (TPR) repeat protein
MGSRASTGEPPVAIQPAASVSAIAVLPFTVRGSAEYDYLAEGLVDLLSTKLDGAGELRSVDSHALLSYASQEFDGPLDPAAAKQTAEHFGASLYLLGEVLEAGNRLHISATLYSHDQQKPLSRATQEGEASQIFDLLDQLTSELLAEQISGPSAQVSRMAALTTSSLPALKKYLQAEDLLRAGHFTDALTVFQEAVDLDPDFALAWYRLSVAAEWATRRDLSDQAATRAASLSDRLSGHYRRLLEARLTARRGDPIEAESFYRNILSSHPEDVEAWAQLSEVLSHHGYLTGLPLTSSREAWEKVLELEPDYVMGLWHLARVAGAEGDGPKLQEINQRIVALNPEADRLVETLALEAFGGHSLRDQQEILETLRGSTDTIVGVTIWSVALVYDDFEGIATMAEVLTEPSRSYEARRLGHAIRVYMDMARGRWSDTQTGLESLARISQAAAMEYGGLLATLDLAPTTESDLEELLGELKRWDTSLEPAALVPTNFLAAHDEIRPQVRHYLIGVMEAQLGRESAVASAAELEALPGTDRARDLAQDLARGIRARWLLSQGDPAGALRELDSLTYEALSYQDTMSSPFLSLSPERYLKATLLVEMGEYERALPILSSFSETSFFDEVFVAPSHFLRGEAYAALGQPEMAFEHYSRFIELWQDCQLPLCSRVEDAHSRLTSNP